MLSLLSAVGFREYPESLQTGPFLLVDKYGVRKETSGILGCIN